LSAKVFVTGLPVIYNAHAHMKDFRPGDWCFDPYAKQCDRCDIVIGRYAVMVDDKGWRHVLFWPHSDWDGVEGSARCRRHSKVSQEWIRLF
jgi:hypothetical protein